MNSLHLQNIKLVIFDFDGTIADTSEGILDSHRYALKAMKSEMPSDEVLRSVIGGNLLKTYIDIFGFSENDAKQAVKIYRERYSSVGIHKAELYPDFKDMLSVLQKHGIKIGVATLKAEKFAKQMLFELGIDQYFDIVCGMDDNDNLSKADLIRKCIDFCVCKQDETILVGDSENDFIGAEQAGVGFIAVTYGFGFKNNEHLKNCNTLIVCNSVKDIMKCVIK